MLRLAPKSALAIPLPMINYSIRAENPGEADAISKLHNDAFKGDAKIESLVPELRKLEAPFATTSVVAQSLSGEVLGHVMLSHSWLDAPDRLIDILVLSPLSVATAAQKQGIGTALIERAIDEASVTRSPILILEGNPAFYGPRGFEKAKDYGICSPSLRIPEAALQMVRLPSYKAGTTGTLVYREIWWELDSVDIRRTTS
ncbi:MAG: N-acetyltransferase [Pseudomonadota bacterium]